MHSEDELINYYKLQTEDIRLLTFKLLYEKFEEKYKSILDDEQKNVLKEYICNVANTNSFDVFVRNKVSEIKVCLTEVVNKIKDSDVMKIKINEVVNQLDKINPGKTVKDNHVMVLMLSYELLKEAKKQLGGK
jgi:predicted transport protein